MALYKVLQDIEAEDKFLGPLTLKQFIFAGITAVSLYLSVFTLVRGIWFVAVVLAPLIFVMGFLAWPWGRDQPTEVWLLAKLRFMLKPHRRIWNQDGAQQLVTITAPKRETKQFTNNLSQIEVKSRLKALADTIDSRGWAVKNVNVNLFAQPSMITDTNPSDRLIDLTSLPMDVPNNDITASDDIMDAQNNPVAQQLDTLIKSSSQAYRQKVVDNMHQPHTDPKDSGWHKPEPKPDYWFLNEPSSHASPTGQSPGSKYAQFGDQVVTPGAAPPAAPASAQPTEDELKQIAQLKVQQGKDPISYSHMRTILPISEQQALAKKQQQAVKKPPKAVTPPPDPVILGLAKNDDLNIATIARQANQAKDKKGLDDGEEVVIPLH